MMDEVKRLHEWGAWEREMNSHSAAECDRQRHKSVTLDQEPHARKASHHGVHRREHTSAELAYEEITALVAKRGEPLHNQ